MNTIVAEKAVIGIMLMKPEMQDDAFSSLTYKMFELKALGNIFLLCKDMADKGQRADTVSVIAKCDDDTKALAMQCFETVPSLSGYNTYINCVMDGWRKRELTAALAKLLTEDGDADEMSAALFHIAERQQYIMAHQKERSAKDFADGIDAFLSWMKKPSDSIQTGFGGLDTMTGGLARNGVTVIAARPGKGKSTLALQMACQISQNALTLYQSMEMSREQLYTVIFSRWAQIDSTRITNHRLTDEEESAIQAAADHLKSKYRLILDDSSLTSLADVETTIKERKPEVVVIDHLGLVAPPNVKEKRNDELAALTRGLKQLAMKYHIYIIELVQAARAADTGMIKMSDMFGSATIEHDADMIIAINPGMYTKDREKRELNPPTDGDTVIEVVKNRHGACGQLDFVWVKPFHLFCEVSNHE